MRLDSLMYIPHSNVGKQSRQPQAAEHWWYAITMMQQQVFSHKVPPSHGWQIPWFPCLALCTKDTARHDHEKGTESFMPDIGLKMGCQMAKILGKLRNQRWKMGTWNKWCLFGHTETTNLRVNLLVNQALRLFQHTELEHTPKKTFTNRL